ncbi:SUMF1/EgtB/PvdO family nonheme iron enzyme [Thioflexithrix psekupsensis]|uniref:Sulfatase-modifying factor enzyme-like domain-containing protein n=1 Tax=Thioflexithrix psekupsensis TaxID=1570016 RepID=A0A251XAK2_9GAMM|nr:SUMF1/EgtB/PvdO family nonheme iron enzyme [Thioflexithrix psekupsensis]OUD15338.1 hypothetical protein TPSD3_02070 [Thioflexithrix psekupsensis]
MSRQLLLLIIGLIYYHGLAAQNYYLETSPLIEWKVNQGGNGHFYQWVLFSEKVNWRNSYAQIYYNPPHPTLINERHYTIYPATITHVAEHEFIVHHVLPLIERSIDHFWLGGIKENEQEWQWVNLGESWQYHPIFSNAQMAHYLAMDQQGHWLGLDREMTVAGVIVEYDPKIVQWSAAEGGQDHWYGIMTYTPDPLGETTLNLERLQQHAAAQSWAGQRGRLVSITSEAENQWITQRLLRSLFDRCLYTITPNQGIGCQYGNSVAREYLIGARRHPSTHTWQWLSGDTWDYSNWASPDAATQGDYAKIVHPPLQRSDSLSSPATWQSYTPNSTMYAQSYLIEYEIPEQLPAQASYFCDHTERCYYRRYFPPGFYIAQISSDYGLRAGAWGLSLNTSKGTNVGGFNAGSVLAEGGKVPGFIAFYLTQTERVLLKIEEYTGAISHLAVQIQRVRLDGSAQREPVFYAPQVSPGESVFTEPLTPGFYVVDVRANDTQKARGRFGLSVNAQSLVGGVNVGGSIDGDFGVNSDGFAAFYLAEAQNVEMQLFYGKNFGHNTPEYGDEGADPLRLTLWQQFEGGERVLLWQPQAELPAPVIVQPLPQQENQVGMRFVRLPAGEFTMGDNAPIPRHPVRLTQDFYLQTTEVTHEQWHKVMGEWRVLGEQCPTCPVDRLFWSDIQAFLARLNAANEGIYRLPTNAEWEYGARASGIMDAEWLSSPNRRRYGWCEQELTCCGQSQLPALYPVAQKLPNAWGLYDMIGNVREWVQDWSDWSYFEADSLKIDPLGPSASAGALGNEKVIRGYLCSATQLTAGWIEAPQAAGGVGFRLVWLPVL